MDEGSKAPLLLDNCDQGEAGDEDDLNPTPVEERTWDTRSFAVLWVSMIAGPSGLITGSSVLSSGLSWGQTIAAFAVASAVTLCFLCLNAVPGAKYGIPFPVYARASFGIHGAQAVALTRGFVAIYWLSLQIWIGAKAVFYAFRELMPSVFTASTALAHCSSSGGDGDGDGDDDGGSDVCLNLAELIFFLIVVAIHAMVILGGVQRLSKAIRYVAPVQMAACAALLLWALCNVSLGHILRETKTFEKASTESTSLVFMTAVTAATSGWSTMCLNIADLSRYAKSQKAQVLGQCIGFPLTNVLVPAIGMLVAGAAKVLYKKDLWDLISLFGEWNGWVSFFSSMLLLTSVVIINCAANIISPANDFANLSDILTRCGLPRISFRHGALLSLFLAVLLQPWRTFSSADSFLSSFLVGYSSVTGAILGIMVCDFYALRRCELDVPQLYSIETDGPYYFFHGFNLRASAAMAIGIAPCIPGFLAQLGGPDVSEGWKQVYAVSWFVAFAVSFVAYGVASVAFPARITQRNEDEDHWDHQAGGVQPLR